MATIEAIEVLAPLAPLTTLQEVSLVVTPVIPVEKPKEPEKIGRREAWLAGIAFLIVCGTVFSLAGFVNTVREPRSQEPPIFTFEWLLARLLNDVHELKPQEHTPAYDWTSAIADADWPAFKECMDGCRQGHSENDAIQYCIAMCPGIRRVGIGPCPVGPPGPPGPTGIDDSV